MTELGPLLERARDSLEPPPDAFRRLAHRRRRRQRGQRVAAAALALTLAAGGIVVAARAFLGAPVEERPAATTENGRIAFVLEDEGIYAVDPEGGQPELLIEGQDPAWSPDGTQLAFRAPLAGPDWKTTISVASADGTGVRQLTTEEAGVNGAGPPVWSPDGLTLAFARADGIWTVQADGTALRKVTAYQGEFACYDLQPDWSPDGTRIVFAVLCDGGDIGIFVVNADGSGRTQLTGPAPEPTAEWEISDRFPVWSPDGTKIAFVRTPVDRGYEPDIHVMEADGTGVTRLTNLGVIEDRPAWSPDGTRIAFADYNGPLYTMAADGTDIRRIEGVVGCCPSWQSLTGPEEPTADSAPRVSQGPVDPQVTARIEVGDYPLALATGEGAVWVATQPDGPSQIVKVDPERNESVAILSIQGRVRVPDLAAGAGAVWAVSVDRNGQDSLLRIDPSSLEITDGQALADHLGAVAAGPEGVWVVIRDEEAAAPSLARIDPDTGEVLSRTLLPGFVLGMEVSGGSLWLRVSTEDAEGCARLLRVDPATNAIVDDIVVAGPAQAGPGGLRLAVGEGRVWVNCREHPEKLFAAGVDTSSGDESARASLPDGVFWPIGASAEGVWFAGFDSDDRPRLLLVDPAGGEVRVSMDAETSFVESAVYDPALGAIWIPDSHGGSDSLLRIDVRP